MADEIFLELHGEESMNAVLEMLIMNLADTNALTSLIINTTAKTDYEREELLKGFKEESSKYAKAIMISLQQRRGHINLDDMVR